jgi:hypothetical protein
VLLKVQPGDIVAWLEAQRTSTEPDNVSSPTHHLPTPVSTSPEPLPGTALNDNSEPSVKADPLHSPIMPSWFLKSNNLPHVSVSLPPVYASWYWASCVLHQTQGLSRNSLMHAIVDATSNRSISNIKPQTAKEFNDMFNPYVERINTITEINEEILSRQHTFSWLHMQYRCQMFSVLPTIPNRVFFFFSANPQLFFALTAIHSIILHVAYFW